jgi:hypothetical protein
MVPVFGSPGVEAVSTGPGAAALRVARRRAGLAGAVASAGVFVLSDVTGGYSCVPVGVVPHDVAFGRSVVARAVSTATEVAVRPASRGGAGASLVTLVG